MSARRVTPLMLLHRIEVELNGKMRLSVLAGLLAELRALVEARP